MHVYVLGVAVIAGSIASVVALIRRSRFMTLIRIATGLIGTVFCAVPAAAGSFSAQMQVSVRVIPRTIVTVDRQPATVEITASDVARGYVDIPQIVAFRIRSNAVNGYTLQFEPITAPFRRAEITWNGIVMVI